MNIDKKILAVVVLSVTATLLTVGLFSGQPAKALVAVEGRDYQLVTGQLSGGGEGLYVEDQRTGLMAVFTYDPNVRGLRARAIRPLSDAFPR